MTRSFLRLSVFAVGLVVGLTLAAPAKPRRKFASLTRRRRYGRCAVAARVGAAQETGIEVVPTFFPRTDLAVQAVVAGEADLGSAAGIAVVKAVESGMNVRVIGEQVRNEWQLVSPVSFKDPKQLDGKRVGYHAPITVTEALVKWMAQHYKITPTG